MPMRWFVVALLALACHHDPPPEEPLPVSSTGTPIGFLIDDTQMHLSTDQLGSLRGIDDNLRRQLDDLDKASKKQVGSGAGVQQQQQPPMQPMGGRGGRRRGGGMANGSAHTAPRANEAAADKLADERNDDVKAALERVFAVLEPTQRDRAKQVLSDHDIDIDLDQLATPQPQPPPQQLPPPPVAPIEEPPPSPPAAAPQPPPTIPPPMIPPPSQAGK
jgi:hypothetical protein